MFKLKEEYASIISVKMNKKYSMNNAEEFLQRILDVVINNESIGSLLILSELDGIFLNTVDDFLLINVNKETTMKIIKTVSNRSYSPSINFINKEIISIDSDRNSNEPIEIVLESIIQQVIDLYQTRANISGIKISFQKEENLPNLFGYLDEIRNIVDNIIKKAINSSDKGIINVSLKKDKDIMKLNLEIPKNKHSNKVRNKIINLFRKRQNDERTEVLLVENNLDITTILKYDLERSGFLVHAVETDQVAFEYLNKHIPSIILCDIMMHSLNLVKFRTLFFQSERFCRIPFVFLIPQPFHTFVPRCRFE